MKFFPVHELPSRIEIFLWERSFFNQKITECTSMSDLISSVLSKERQNYYGLCNFYGFELEPLSSTERFSSRLTASTAQSLGFG